ncbi:MAG: uroporphyrinogen-III C-methyltransferase [Thaumarchaeota archaeon]|nr:uroporphyrinogen-III C-methyltransferase [Nitrososphaerota archaeon]
MGKVYLVGAGPGDSGLLTVKGLGILKKADVVLYDRLVSDEVIRLVPKNTIKIRVGKEEGHVGKIQSRINDIMLEKVKSGKVVVRLKGGDPFVFGRGGEEVQYLRKHGIVFEVVPGVTSVFAVPAYAGIPITHRNFASSIGVVTGTSGRGKSNVDLRKISPVVDTLVILMGVSNLAEIIRQISSKKNPKTDVAVIEWGTTRRQRVVFGTLDDIVERVSKVKVNAPAVIVVGKVVSLGKELTWFK